VPIHITRSTPPNAVRIEIMILGDDADVRALTGTAIIKAIEGIIGTLPIQKQKTPARAEGSRGVMHGLSSQSRRLAACASASTAAAIAPGSTTRRRASSMASSTRNPPNAMQRGSPLSSEPRQHE